MEKNISVLKGNAVRPERSEINVRHFQRASNHNNRNWFKFERFNVRHFQRASNHNQKRKLPELTRKDSPTDDNVFMLNELLYGVHARGEGFLTLPFLAYKGGAASVDAWAEK